MERFTPKKPLVVAATVGLTVVSFVLLMYDLEACLNIAFAVMSMASSGPFYGKPIGTILTFVLGAIFLLFGIFSLDYNLRHAGEPRSRKFLGISILIQAAIAVIGLVIF